MDRYLLEHPTAMPAAEAAMTYLFSSPARVLTLVPAPEGSTTTEEQVAARKSA
jgi:hypothetical protein